MGISLEVALNIIDVIEQRKKLHQKEGFEMINSAVVLILVGSAIFLFGIYLAVTQGSIIGGVCAAIAAVCTGHILVTMR